METLLIAYKIGIETPCTMLAGPLAVRLWQDDLKTLIDMGIEPGPFIRGVIHQTLKKI